MGGTVIGFIIWAIVGAFIIGLGISAFFMKKVVVLGKYKAHHSKGHKRL